MDNKNNSNLSNEHEFNIISNFLNPKRRAKYKNSHYSPILQGCMNTRSGKEKDRNVCILLDSGISSTIVMGRLTSKLKQKISSEKCVVNPSREVHNLKEDERRFLSAGI